MLVRGFPIAHPNTILKRAHDPCRNAKRTIAPGRDSSVSRPQLRATRLVAIQLPSDATSPFATTWFGLTMEHGQQIPENAISFAATASGTPFARKRASPIQRAAGQMLAEHQPSALPQKRSFCLSCHMVRARTQKKRVKNWRALKRKCVYPFIRRSALAQVSWAEDMLETRPLPNHRSITKIRTPSPSFGTDVVGDVPVSSCTQDETK